MNISHLRAATYYGALAFEPIIDGKGRIAYLKQNVPIRIAVDQVNKVNLHSEPVAIFAPSPLVAGLRAPYQSATWYSFRFNREISLIENSDLLRELLTNYGIKYIILDNNWGDHQKREMLLSFSSEIFHINSLSVRVLD